MNSHLAETDSPLLNKDQSVEEMLLSLNENVPSVNPSFIKLISACFVAEVMKMTSKQHQSLKLSGNILCKLLINSIKYMNKKPTLKVGKIFNSIFK